ncbi:phosphatase PAP2 family protein, partial [Staphylococcus epidermidis]
IIARPRPYNHLLVDHGYSFPSGHSNASTLFALAILLVVIPLIKNKAIRYSIAIVVVIFWIGVLSCRLYFHAHYLTDVIGGFS